MAGGHGTYFFYGTLMDRDVLNIVSGLNLGAARLRPALLLGYRRVRVQDAQYPAVLPSEGHSVQGCAVHGITAAAAARVEFFENDGYDLSVERVFWANSAAPGGVVRRRACDSATKTGPSRRGGTGTGATFFAA